MDCVESITPRVDVFTKKGTTKISFTFQHDTDISSEIEGGELEEPERDDVRMKNYSNRNTYGRVLKWNPFELETLEEFSYFRQNIKNGKTIDSIELIRSKLKSKKCIEWASRPKSSGLKGKITKDKQHVGVRPNPDKIQRVNSLSLCFPIQIFSPLTISSLYLSSFCSQMSIAKKTTLLRTALDILNHATAKKTHYETEQNIQPNRRYDIYYSTTKAR